ncbi:chorismate-binding protein [Mesoflavibacter sp. CH_XMU1404-2]|uniref:chorismate-binding protein n=1 Tax=Mesoflavibacter sp. CH_XMU1404-2 TaxID=3107766 RepID=UPI00300807D8
MQQSFFNQLQNRLVNQLPFVAYRKPNETSVSAILQKNDAVNYYQDFTNSGFVFSPFENIENAIIFPLNESEIIEFKDEIILDETEHSQPNFNLENREEAKQFHINLVENAVKAIKNESFKKVVVSRVEQSPFNSSETILLFKRLLNNYKTAMVYCWYHPKVGLWLGATPETLLKIEGNRLQTMSLAGTQPYVNTTDVTWQNKEIEEQQFVTDFIVDSLKPLVNRVSTTKRQTIKAGQLLHLQTKISAVFDKANFNFKNVLKALHPTPAVCGLPKAPAKDFILKNENYNREFYTGFLGELNFTQTKSRNTNRKNVENNAYQSIKTVTNLFVNLRCLQIKNDQALIYVGGGITKDSNPEKEWEETVAKSLTTKSLL